jgi:segregation and condensation protein A
MKYEVAVGSFSGPLDALLELVERNKLDITEVSLAAVTGDFLRYIAALNKSEDARTVTVVHAIADFLSVATRLLLLKSRTLLPSDEIFDAEVEDPALLAEQLRTYQAVKPAIVAFRKAYAKRQSLVARPYLKGMRAQAQVYAPPAGLGIAMLHAAASQVLQLATVVAKEVTEVHRRVVSLQKAVSDLVHRLATSGAMKFSELVADRSSSDRIVIFLAALHLAREQRVTLMQDEPFSDIVLEHGTNA